jgi:hypothetical protein
VSRQRPVSPESDYLVEVAGLGEGKDRVELVRQNAKRGRDLHLVEGNAGVGEPLQRILRAFELHRLMTAVVAKPRELGAFGTEFEALQEGHGLRRRFEHTARLGLERQADRRPPCLTDRVEVVEGGSYVP